ncbi:chorismate-binding protein [Streptomyces sp. NPDC002076]
MPAPVSAVCSAHRRPELPAAAFPPGSVTAVPKSRALHIIEELETAPRGSYCGGIDRAEGVLRFGTGGAANSHGSLGDFLTTVGAHLRLTLRLTHHVS